MFVIALLVAGHIACFVTSVVMLERQKQYIDEVDDAGVACIAMHRLALDCRCVSVCCGWGWRGGEGAVSCIAPGNCGN